MPEGPRWAGDQKLNLTPDLQYAESLPPKVTDKYVFFFGYEGPHPEVCLQQLYPSPFYDPDAIGGDDENGGEPDTGPVEFYTAEQYMMYWKALLMGDDEAARKIADCKTPAEAKAFGREVKSLCYRLGWFLLSAL